MAETGGSKDRSDSLSSTTSAERVIRGLDGESYKVRARDYTQSTRSDGVTGDNRSTEEGGAPEYTRPDSLNLFGWDDEKQAPDKKTPRASSSKSVVSAKTTPGINAKTCGNIVAGFMDAISFLLTRTPVLGLNEEEEKEMGESLYETISNFPATSGSVKLLNYLAPWAGLLHTSSKIVWKRMAFLNSHKQQKQPPPNRNPFPNSQPEIFAPDPSRAN